MAEYTIYFNEILSNIGWDSITQFCENIPTGIQYRGEELTVDTITKKIQSLYGNYEIAFETVDSFINEFQRVWNTYINTTIDKLKLYSKVNFDLTEYNHTYNTTDKGDDRYSDTPNEPMQESDSSFEGSIYLTNRSTYENSKVINDNMTLNGMQKYGDISKYVDDPIVNFAQQFDYLFNHLIVVKTDIIRRY